MRFFKNYNEDDVLSKTLMLYFAFQHGAIGMFFLFTELTVVQSSALRGLAMIMPIGAWGVILMVSCFSFVFSVLQVGRVEYIFMIIAGITGMVTFSLLAMASIELSISQTNTLNYIVIASIDMLVAILGGVALWRLKTM